MRGEELRGQEAPEPGDTMDDWLYELARRVAELKLQIEKLEKQVPKETP